MSSHHDHIIEITAQHDALKPFAPENGQPLRFKIGDAVIYANEYGAQFRRRVTGFYQPTGLSVCTRTVRATCWTRHRRGCRYRNPACALTTRRDACAPLAGHCALRLPPGKALGYPRRAMLGAPQRPPNRLRRIGQTTAVAVEPVSR